ncbi:hypothetical protein J4573_22990 [Actinomadura barringtoniae]|uniref:Extradiol ring-cleavage dioxygenase LigAB LigA subunit domain-containing protein n=1 Tax=Actinomadura barringtoniae TaxID=1427535 RepID=A0A939PD15_9ACTN|nr:hypothetical protein [Actinomadura barringtoniae]MBO2449987.1 hypothetical protein [Actinomadura barringtoniae]
MSRYGINKFMRAVNMNPDALAAYIADPAAFVTAWPGGRLAPDEVNALAQRDYGALYAFGAHPYLLWSFAEAVWVPEISRPDLVERYRQAALRCGYPDFST